MSVMDPGPSLRFFAATSGWDGPFQHEQVLVAAHDADEARRLAEAAFGEVAQPVCRTKMRIADLGSGRGRRGGRAPQGRRLVGVRGHPGRSALRLSASDRPGAALRRCQAP